MGEWLEFQPREVAVALAARAALRVLPILEQARSVSFGGNFFADIVLPVCRATGVSCAGASYPGEATQRAASATRAANAAAVDALHGTVGASRVAIAAARAADATATGAHAAKGAIAHATAAAAAAAGDAAAPIFWSAVSIDATRVEEGATASFIAGSPLWPRGQPDQLQSLWQEFKAALHAAKENWEVWTDWYDDRLAGRVRDEERELAYVRIDDALWMQGPAIVNAAIKRRIEELERTALVPPPEPSPEPGPVLQVTERGLELISQPSEGDFDEVQKALHDRLRRLLPALTDATHRVANAHPALDHIVSEYSDLIARPFDQLDVASLWAVETGLLAFRAAFANLASGSMTEPLEPGHLALLQQAAELHGGFILGFPKGRELTDRADHARLSPEIIAQIEPPARQILESLACERDFVETRTRKFFAAVDESLVVHGWKTARTGHAAYVVTRNSLIALGKILIRANSALATVVGGTVLNYVDPGLQMFRRTIS